MTCSLIDCKAQQICAHKWCNKIPLTEWGGMKRNLYLILCTAPFFLHVHHREVVRGWHQTQVQNTGVHQATLQCTGHTRLASHHSLCLFIFIKLTNSGISKYTWPHKEWESSITTKIFIQCTCIYSRPHTIVALEISWDFIIKHQI